MAAALLQRPRLPECCAVPQAPFTGMGLCWGRKHTMPILKHCSGILHPVGFTGCRDDIWQYPARLCSKGAGVAVKDEAA